MKIAIQGHPTRGKEVIRILESLGGINDGLHEGNNPDCYYELHGNIIWCVSTKGINFKYCTLEEFEKEFPFKIGDLCVYSSEFRNEEIIVKILGIAIKDDCIMYEVGHKDIIKAYSGIYRERHTLKPYKEMKEERNVTLTLDKAKEWYKKGGGLREIALQAFKKEELNSPPRSWEEFCKNGYWHVGYPEKYKALFKLEKLRDCWIQGWEPDWLEVNVQKYLIKKWRDNISIETSYVTHSFLSFPTYEMASDFLNCFRDLIKKAGDLI